MTDSIKILKYIKVTVQEPFSGGILKIFDGNLKILPNIYLHPLKEPSYEGISRDLGTYLEAKQEKDGYILFFTHRDLPYIAFKNPPHWEIEGEPKENVQVDIEVY